MRRDPLDALGLSLRAGAVELYVIRHADAVPESDESFSVYDDYEAHPLSARGVAQAEAIGARCAAAGVAAVYASPIRRARQTAEAIAVAAGVALEEDADLREITIGMVEDTDGLTLRERLEWLALVAMRDGSWSGIEGTEGSGAVRARMLRAFEAAERRHAGMRVALVSHAGSINAALGAIAGTPHDFVFPLANASLSIVRSGGGRHLIMSANDTAHLHEIPARGRA